MSTLLDRRVDTYDNDPLHNILLTTRETREIASDSLLQLQRQNEQIRVQQEQIAEINDNLNVGEKLLRSIGSVFGSFSNIFRFDNSTQHRDEQLRFETKIQEKMANERKNMESLYPNNPNKHTTPTPKFNVSKSSASNDKLFSYMEKQDEALDEIHSVLRDIKSQAKDINCVLVESNLRLDDLNSNMEMANQQIQKEARLCKKYK